MLDLLFIGEVKHGTKQNMSLGNLRHLGRDLYEHPVNVRQSYSVFSRDTTAISRNQILQIMQQSLGDERLRKVHVVDPVDGREYKPNYSRHKLIGVLLVCASVLIEQDEVLRV